MRVSRTALRALSLLAVLAVLHVSVRSASAAETTFDCLRSGGSPVRVAVCQARWEAANTLAHAAAGDDEGMSTQCLQSYAAAATFAASQMLAQNRALPIAAPCGTAPVVATKDDGVLSQVCPGRRWSYANSGMPDVACDFQPPARSANGAAAPASGPTLTETLDWLSTNIPSLSDTAPYAETSHAATMLSFSYAFTAHDCSMHIINHETSVTNDSKMEWDNFFDAPLAGVDTAAVQARASVVSPIAGGTHLYIPLKDGQTWTATWYVGRPDRITLTYQNLEIGPFAASGADRIVRALQHAATLCAAARSNSAF